MGKGTDKLYITHSEWASEDAFSASAGAGVNQKSSNAAFKRLPFNFCAVSLQPFTHPVCTAQGTIFDLTHILPWIKKHGTDPTTGEPLQSSDLVKLNFKKNEEDQYVDPVTFKVLTDNTHIVALKSTGNVYAWDTVERLNVKAKMWRDLVSEEEFARKDIITLQDPQNLESRNLASFKYLLDGTSTLTEEQTKEKNDPSRNVNTAAMGNAARVLKRPADTTSTTNALSTKSKSSQLQSSKATRQPSKTTALPAHSSKPQPKNAAIYTTGRAAASLTSTGFTPHTSSERAILSTEDYLLRPKRIKQSGFARIVTSQGEFTMELLPEFAPKAVWNFVTLAKRGYYNNTIFHRNIRNFMIQGGDPAGTGKGGQSCWGKPFKDELDGPLKHDARGVVSMANKGKDTNGSQFFICYRPTAHLDRKHTIFGRVIDGLPTLDKFETVPVSESSNRPLEDVRIEEVTILFDPFEEFLKDEKNKELADREKEEIRKAGGTEDDRTTWTGKRVRSDGTVVAHDEPSGVGKYLKAALVGAGAGAGTGGRADVLEEEIVEEWEQEAEPVKKKAKTGGFGNFDSW